MKKRNDRVPFRMNESVKSLLLIYCENKNLTLTELIEKALFNYLESENLQDIYVLAYELDLLMTNKNMSFDEAIKDKDINKKYSELICNIISV